MIINLKTESFNPATDVYIGRQNNRRGFKKSIWANPFKTGPDGDREDVIRRYESWLSAQPELMAQLHTLKGKRLACWCAPEPCHGEVLLRLVGRL